MAKGQLDAVLGHIRRLAAVNKASDLTDCQLLAEFSTHQDQTAFTALVRRHGPMVLGICRHVLHHLQDAEDAFQATFLVLARNAGSIRKPEALASWLHGVAYRTAMNARKAAIRRRTHEGKAKTLPSPNPPWDIAWKEVQSILDEEIERLPEKYRAPFVLCFWEGQSRAAAARQLGLKEGTVWSRL
ncbi:MAG TPA: RNA polymerase sigma factor, partial [Gemmataceae bacterium]|nr:RNA polymerase sigma factor [Gemmataceae bacterium]